MLVRITAEGTSLTALESNIRAQLDAFISDADATPILDQAGVAEAIGAGVYRITEVWDIRPASGEPEPDPDTTE